MEELAGDQATWQLGPEMVQIRYRSAGRSDAMLARLGQCELPLTAISSVEFQPQGKRKRWSLWLVLRERADPYAAAGAGLLNDADPFRLTGPASRVALAEYWAEQLGYLVELAPREAGVDPRLALALVPRLPFHVQTDEGTAALDAGRVRLVWSGSAAGRRKREAQRREYPLASLTGVEWAPADGWEWGQLRLLTRAAEAPPGKPSQDLTCLRCNEGKQNRLTLLMAAAITAHWWAASAAAPVALPGGEDARAQEIYERIRELGRLHADGVLTDAEFATKKAELLARL